MSSATCLASAPFGPALDPLANLGLARAPVRGTDHPGLEARQPRCQRGDLPLLSLDDGRLLSIRLPLLQVRSMLLLYLIEQHRRESRCVPMHASAAARWPMWSPDRRESHLMSEDVIPEP
jgi:hypothetical protein